MKKISLNNGITFKNLECLSMNELQIINKNWDALIYAMEGNALVKTNDKICEIIKMGMAVCNKTFLQIYLEYSNKDLIIA